MKFWLESRMPRMFISEELDTRSARAELLEGIVVEDSVSGSGQLFATRLEIPEFLSEVGRQFLEGQIFAYGSDFRRMYKTQDSKQCPDEITIMSPETQIPIIGAFAEEFDAFLPLIFPWTLARNTYQLRIYEPRYAGHPEHVDYAPGFTISERDGRRKGLTSVSFSLPISWNGGKAPAFKVRHADTVFLQEKPGSLVAFGPRVLHSHPAAPDLDGQYAWLISQAYFEFDVDG